VKTEREINKKGEVKGESKDEGCCLFSSSTNVARHWKHEARNMLSSLEIILQRILSKSSRSLLPFPHSVAII